MARSAASEARNAEGGSQRAGDDDALAQLSSCVSEFVYLTRSVKVFIRYHGVVQWLVSKCMQSKQTKQQYNDSREKHPEELRKKEKKSS
jgi:hypothetical protein